jgi:hypothetical protein
MAAALTAAIITGVIAAGTAAYGGVSQAQARKKQKEQAKYQRLLEAYEDATGVAGTGAAGEQAALEEILGKTREVLG